MRTKLLILNSLFILLCINLYAQNNEAEFQGLIKFKHTVIATDKNYNVDYDYSGIGKTSDYYFKNGNIKWLTYNCYFKMDLFIAKEDKDYFLTNQSDTIYSLKNNNPDFEVLDVKIEKNADTILGYVCDVLILKLKPIKSDNPISYRRYYFSNKFYINPNNFKNTKSNRYDLIYGKIHSIPLKIEYEWPTKKIIWEAYGIEPTKLDDEFFKLDKKSKYGYW